MKQENLFKLTVAAAATVFAVTSSARAAQIFSFENPADIRAEHIPNPTAGPGRFDEVSAYVWGDSFDSSLVDHAQSTVGATDGSYSMKITDANGGFSWGSQVLFNDINDPRWQALTTSTRILMDVSTPAAGPDYAVGFAALNYSVGFLDSYNVAGAGNNYQFASGPVNQTVLTTQTYSWDFGGQTTAVGLGNWSGVTDYVIFHMNTNSPAVNTEYYYDNFRVLNEDKATRSTWNATGDGNWSSAWNNGVPNAVGAPAIFAGAGNGNVTLNSAVTVGSIIFDAAVTNFGSIGANAGITSAAQLPPIVNYAITGTGSLTINTTAAEAEIYTIAGNHSIGVPVTVSKNLRVDTSAGFGPDANPGLPGGGRFSNVPTTSLTFGAAVSLNGAVTLRTSGAGSVAFNGPISGAAGGLLFNGGQIALGGNVNVGTVSIAPAAKVAVAAGGGKVLRTTALTVGNGSLSSSLDLADNAAIIDYSASSPLADIAAQLTSGYAGGAWNGVGISSSVAGASASFGLGYAEASIALGVAGGTFAGQSVDGTAVLIRFTRYGDANLDGTVNLDDFTALAAAFGGAGGWGQGNFNYDSAINLDDFTALAANFGLSADLPRSAVPEPTGLALIGATATAMLRRSRRRLI